MYTNVNFKIMQGVITLRVITARTQFMIHFGPFVAILRVVQTQVILFLKSMSEGNGSDI